MARMMQQQKKKNPESSLPPGFRFHPTDEELILHYLQKKVASIPFPVSIIADVDIYKFDPWDLPGMATFGEKEWYFFSPRDRKYPNGARPNRAAASGYWKATGTDKIISVPSIISSTGALSGGGGGQVNSTTIGVKKALVFYKGRPPKGIKTNWIMHEYRLADAPSYSVKPTIKPINKDYLSMRLDDWVLCRIYKKPQSNLSHQSPTTTTAILPSSDHDQEGEEEEDEEQFVQQTLLPLSNSKTTTTTTTPLMPQKSSSFSNLFDAMDYSLLSSFLSDPQFSFTVPPAGNPNDDSNLASMGNVEQQQPCFGSMSNGGYLHNKLPQLQHSLSNEEVMLNRPKRERSDGDDHVLMMMMMNPSKKSINSRSSSSSNSFTNNYGDNGNNWGRTTSFHDTMAPTTTHHNDQNGFVNQTAFNQQLLLSHHLQFQG